jgi:NAD-dependent dihydropyrimidine dehydrogenase PreA subunit
LSRTGRPGGPFEEDVSAIIFSHDAVEKRRGTDFSYRRVSALSRRCEDTMMREECPKTVVRLAPVMNTSAETREECWLDRSCGRQSIPRQAGGSRGVEQVLRVRLR